MTLSLQNINISRKRVLIAPLDWGLGHATRCIPIINEFEAQGFEVMLAAERSTTALLEKEFPHLKMLSLKGYRITYSKSKRLFIVKMLSQIKKIYAAIRYENKWLQQIIKEHKIDILVSDNRYGFYNKKCYNIFITHQLNIQTRNKFSDGIVQKINFAYINKFDECWVPDEEGSENLAGKLSHPTIKPAIPLKYIGILSRFSRQLPEKKIDLLVMLSGPEPQRTMLEAILLKQLQKIKLKTIVVRGLPEEITTIESENELVEIMNHLPAKELNKLLCATKMVLARSGYSTVMDIAVLQQRSILIPTPGQTEQEYLAKYLADKKYCITAAQSNFDLLKEIQKLNKISLVNFPSLQIDALKNTIKTLK